QFYRITVLFISCQPRRRRASALVRVGFLHAEMNSRCPDVNRMQMNPMVGRECAAIPVFVSTRT
ncbi:MAG: hypothetical protein OSB38_41800, partial [Paraburkholderia fungorum]|nr:hypothetical protein [Paraburkholderia fungorum]